MSTTMMSTPDPIYSSLLGVDSESDLATKHKKENSGILGGRPSANIITSRSLLTCYVYLAEDIRVSVTTRQTKKKKTVWYIFIHTSTAELEGPSRAIE